MTRIPLESVPHETAELLLLLKAVGRTAGAVPYAVGGFVRDLLHGTGMDATPDIDVMAEGKTEAFAKTAAEALKGTLRGPSPFMTYRIDYADGRHLDIVTPRAETYSKPGKLPRVKRATAAEDLARRDFTVNAMAFPLDVKDPVLMDPFGGLADLIRRRLHILHERSFVDDPTRIIRAARFCVRCGLAPDGKDLSLLRAAIPLLGAISAKRLEHELELVGAERNPQAVRRLLAEWGVEGDATAPLQ